LQGTYLLKANPISTTSNNEFNAGYAIGLPYLVKSTLQSFHNNFLHFDKCFYSALIIVAAAA